MDRIEPKPGNHRIFHEIQMPGDLCTVFTGTPTSNRQNSRASMAVSHVSAELKPGYRTFSSKLCKITKNQHPDRSYGTGSDKPTKNL